MDTTRLLGPGDGYDVEEQEPPKQQHHPLLLLHMLLQGRYWLAILLALIGIAIGAVLGYKLPQPKYSCSGMIDIRPVIPRVLFDNNGAMPMYDTFVGTQMLMLKSERCIDMAMSSPVWLNEGKRSNSPEAALKFKKYLDVMRDGEIVRVTFSDPDSKTTQDAVQAVIEAYTELNDELDPERPRKQRTMLEDLKKGYEETIARKELELQQIAAQGGAATPEGLRVAFQYKLNEFHQLETDWKYSVQDVENYVILHPTMAPSTAPATMAATTAPAKARSYTPEQIAGMGDPDMRELLKARNALDGEITQIHLTSNVGPQSPILVNKQKELDYLNKKIEEYAKNWTPMDVESTPGMDPSRGGSPSLTLAQLKEVEQLHKKRWDVVTQEKDDLEKLMTKLETGQSEEKRNQAWLDETKQALEELRVKELAAGRIWVVSSGERPVFKDRRILIAGAASFGGALFGFGIVLLIGLMDRRLRTIDQARMSLRQGMRVLGMLPSLPKNLEDPSAASFAALCVHHIRMLLQVMPRLDGHPTIAVTSPSPGDGKTSLTLSLALSYAASGKSTLLIDCDIVGAGLTRRVNAIIRRRIGQILIRENLITPAELREALSAAQRTGRKLGEVLVDEGFVDADQLTKALKVQGETSVGLLDVMRGEMLEDCVADTGTARLWILPVGSAQAEHGATISPEGFRAVLEQARKRFDVILIDTGPIPGSIESSVAASQADGVVLTVSRGEQGPLVRRANEHLRDIGGRVLGIVFNRATPEDFSSSYGAMSSPSIRSASETNREPTWRNLVR